MCTVRGAGRAVVLTRPVVLYDGDCAFCVRMVALLARLDRAGRFDAVPAARRGEVAGLPALGEAALLGAMHLVLPDGRWFAGGEAVREIVRRLPLGVPVATLMGLPGVRVLVDRGYALVAANRHRLGCAGAACAAPRAGSAEPIDARS
jgi:predicted DCC family thiol-disulfide oxidoreductase YuxK